MQLCCRRRLNRRPLWFARVEFDVGELLFLPGIILNETLTLMTHKAEWFRHQCLSTFTYGIRRENPLCRSKKSM